MASHASSVSILTDDLEEPLIRKSSLTTDDESPFPDATQDLESILHDETKQNVAVVRTIRVLRRTPVDFWEDARKFKDGSVPHSIVVACVLSIACGLASVIYFKLLYGGLNFFWHILPEMIVVDKWPEWAYIFWMPLCAFVFGSLVWATMVYIGDPGDLPIAVKDIHEKGYYDMEYTIPMTCASLFLVYGGGSLGPEAPLGGICASIAGWISRKVFKQTDRNIIRKHTLMGMAGALAGFFGCPLGGSLFALEIQSRLGYEYFEHALEAIFCGQLTMAVFRTIVGLDVGPLYKISDTPVSPSKPIYVFVGVILGLFGGFIAWCFKMFHKQNIVFFKKAGLLEPGRSYIRALVGTAGYIAIGMFIPYTLFWSENELQTIFTNGPPETLPNAFPANGLIDFKMDTAFNAFLVGFFKIVAISMCKAANFRGGFIFPLFFVGASFGQCLHHLFPLLPIPYATLCVAGAVNVAITRTPLATALILTNLSGEPNVITAVSVACVTSALATAYMPFIGTQKVREDLDAEVIFYTEEEYEVDDLDNAEKKR